MSLVLRHLHPDRNNFEAIPDLRMIPEFEALYKEDKTKDKRHANKAFLFAAHFSDSGSIYRNIPRELRWGTIAKDLWGEEEPKMLQIGTKWRNLIEAAVDRYEFQQKTSIRKR